MTSLFRASEAAERRKLIRIGSVIFASAALLITLLFWVKPFGDGTRGLISVVIETPFVGEGVASGAPVIMHGVKVGHVAAVANVPGGGVRLQTLLHSGPTAGLTEAMKIDFRPSNYFGVTGVNILPADGGKPLRSGARLNITPDGNFALQALLYRLGEISHQVINQRLIGVVERGTRYADELTPLLETMLIVGRAVADVQTVSTEQLLRNTTGVSVGFPGWADSLVRTVDDSLHTGLNDINIALNDDLFNYYITTYDEQLTNHYNSELELARNDIDTFTFGPVHEFFDAAATDLFVKVGTLLSSHTYELFPVVEEIRSITAVVPGIVNAEGIGDTLRELHSRLVRMYEGSGEQRAMQVRIMLDQFPAVAAPLWLAIGAQG